MLCGWGAVGPHIHHMWRTEYRKHICIFVLYFCDVYSYCDFDPSDSSVSSVPQSYLFLNHTLFRFYHNFLLHWKNCLPLPEALLMLLEDSIE
jgi:hypothetical protein